MITYIEWDEKIIHQVKKVRNIKIVIELFIGVDIVKNEKLDKIQLWHMESFLNNN